MLLKRLDRADTLDLSLTHHLFVLLTQAEPDEFEASVAQELLNLEMTSTDLKAPLRDLYITAAKEAAAKPFCCTCLTSYENPSRKYTNDWCGNWKRSLVVVTC